MSRILHLTLKRRWFDMIALGKKPEEYRDVTPYWIQRLTWHEFHKCDVYQLAKYVIDQDVFRRDFEIVQFRNGYNKDSPVMQVEFKEIDIGRGNPVWGAEHTVFRIKLGKILSIKNYK